MNKVDTTFNGAIMNSGVRIVSHPEPIRRGNQVVLPKGAMVEVTKPGGGTMMVALSEDWVGTFYSNGDTDGS